ncbi:hypothetical protein RhiJN_13835 [Ceratobasidium sp. AG-Ba]|nr:hypothetical protein RhiJN_13835 [Ceratobasidium sp. AG-Ba]QRW14394.1 hypothetical protein RhiLY_13393 [Ceratobasidium sp. AG-Ba]
MFPTPLDLSVQHAAAHQFLAIILIAITAALHIYLQTLPGYGDKTFHEALAGSGGGSAAVFIVCAAVVWPVGTLLGYHVRLLALNITTIEQLRISAQASLETEGSGPGPNAFHLGRWTRNAAWGACRPAGLGWIEGWKPFPWMVVKEALRCGGD